MSLGDVLLALSVMYACYVAGVRHAIASRRKEVEALTQRIKNLKEIQELRNSR